MKPNAITFECGSCGQHVSATKELVGMSFACPNCGEPLVVPVFEAARIIREPVSLKLKLATLGKSALDNTQRHPLLSTLGAVLIIIVVFIIGFHSNHRSKNEAVATKVSSSQIVSNTQHYLTQISVIINAHPQSKVNFDLIKEGQYDEFRSQASSVMECFSATGDGIRALPTLGVDQDAVNFGLYMANICSAMTGYWRDSGELSQIIQRYNENQGLTMLDAFVRGALGDDPINVYRDAKSDGNRLQSAIDGMDQRRRNLVEQAQEYDSRYATLRTTLTQRYQVQF